MAIKKSELYRSLWASCDELRGSMDASQYKDYVLVLLFMKYVSDKGDRLMDIPQGGSFQDMIQLKGKPGIGDQMNKIIGALAKANDLVGVIDQADFNDPNKLGQGKDMIDRLSNLIEIFENPALDFRNNRAENDDLLGDAYEYLMRHFAQDSGKSKGQFYTPSEVSQIMARLIGIEQAQSASETLYDPTCGSGSLLLKAADLCPHDISIYGQEKDNTTRALAVMNMWLHGRPAAEIKQGNTLSDPLFTDERLGGLKTFDYAVANPPFSDKAWSNGLDAAHDPFQRFQAYDLPPSKNGDFAYLLHLITSLKSTGKAAIILPLGVLFRGNAEANIRRELVRRGYLKGIIGLPPNLFFGTGIAASIVVIDKENAAQRRGIFMIDASRGFMKDGNKNRLRAQDIHKIVDVFHKQAEVAKYSRLVPYDEIADPKNGYNLNLPRYIDSQETEDIQDIAAHLQGGIPARDVDALQAYWTVYPSLKTDLFQPLDRPGYYRLSLAPEEIKARIFGHPEFTAYGATLQAIFASWRKAQEPYLRELDAGCLPKAVIHRISEALLDAYRGQALVNAYDLYQILMDYWAERMQDDLYELAADGWAAGKEVMRLMKKASKKGGKDKPISGLDGLEGRLIPPRLMVRVYFAAEQAEIDALQQEVDRLQAELEELSEEHGGEEGLLAEALTDRGSLSKGSVSARLKELGKQDADNAEEWALLQRAKKLMSQESQQKSAIKTAEQELEQKVIEQYPQLSLPEVQRVVVEEKWMATLDARLRAERDAISYRLTERIKELAERYATPLPELSGQVEDHRRKVAAHLAAMGYTEGGITD